MPGLLSAPPGSAPSRRLGNWKGLLIGCLVVTTVVMGVLLYLSEQKHKAHSAPTPEPATMQKAASPTPVVEDYLSDQTLTAGGEVYQVGGTTIRSRTPTPRPTKAPPTWAGAAGKPTAKPAASPARPGGARTPAPTKPSLIDLLLPTAAVAGLPTQAAADKAPGGEDETDDPDDDFTDDDNQGVKKTRQPAASPWFNSLVAATWRAVGGASTQVCYASTGKELRHMATGDECTVIILTRGRSDPYKLAKPCQVKGVKVIIGNPIDMPRVTGYDHHISHTFAVLPGARLDLRFVDVVRAYGDMVSETYKYIAGGCVMVYPLGTLMATGCIFQSEDQDLTQFLYDLEIAMRPGFRYRNFGGFVMQMGGIVQLNGCMMLTIRPYGLPYFNSVIMGRTVLVLAGAATLVGCYDITVQAYSVTVSIGNQYCVLGGALTMVGGGIVSVYAAQAQYGAGLVVFVGGGTFVTVGTQYVSVVTAIHTAGFGQWAVGGGVMIHVGLSMTRAWCAAAVHNYGHTLAVGGGILQIIGGAISAAVHQWFFTGVGGVLAQGAGDMHLIGVAYAKSVVCEMQYGLGFVYGLGSGLARLIYSPYASAHVIRAQVGLATEFYVGAGLLVSINNTRYQVQLLNYFNGLGSTYYVGAGGLLLVRTFTSLVRLLSFSTTNLSFTVGGVGVSSPTASKGDFWITNGQVTSLKPSSSSPSPKRRETRRAAQVTAVTATAPAPTPSLLSGESVPLPLDGRFLDKNLILMAQNEYHDTVATGVLESLSDNSSSSSSRRPSGGGLTVGGVTVPWVGVPSFSDLMSTVAGLMEAPREVVMRPFSFRRTDRQHCMVIEQRPGPTSAYVDGSVCQVYETLEQADQQQQGASATSGPASSALQVVQAAQAQADPPLPYLQAIFAASLALINQTDTPPPPPPQQQQDEEKEEEEEQSDSSASLAPGEPEPAAPRAAADSSSSGEGGPQRGGRQLFIPGYRGLESSSADTAGREVDLPPSGLVTVDLTVFCIFRDGRDSYDITSGCTDPSTLKTVVKNWLKQGDDLSVAVSTDSVPPSLAAYLLKHKQFDYQGSRAPDDYDSACPGYTRYGVSVVTTDTNMTQTVGRLWDRLAKSPGPLLTALQRATDKSAPIWPCGLTATKTQQQVLPAMKDMPAYKPSDNGLAVGPIVALSDGESLTPVREVVTGRQYVVYLRNFPPGNKVVVQLIKGVEADKPLNVLTVDSFVDRGLTSVPMTLEGTVSQADQQQRWYLKAVSEKFPAIFGYSETFRLKSPPPTPTTTGGSSSSATGA